MPGQKGCQLLWCELVFLETKVSSLNLSGTFEFGIILMGLQSQVCAMFMLSIYPFCNDVMIITFD